MSIRQALCKNSACHPACQDTLCNAQELLFHSKKVYVKYSETIPQMYTQVQHYMKCIKRLSSYNSHIQNEFIIHVSLQ